EARSRPPGVRAVGVPRTQTRICAETELRTRKHRTKSIELVQRTSVKANSFFNQQSKIMWQLLSGKLNIFRRNSCSYHSLCFKAAAGIEVNSKRRKISNYSSVRQRFHRIANTQTERIRSTERKLGGIFQNSLIIN